MAATETIKTNEMTIESRSERIKMLKSQLQTAQEALELAKQNNTLSEEVRADMESEIAFLKDQLKTCEKERRREKTKKIVWKILAVGEAGLIIYLVII